MIYQGSARHPVREIIVHCAATRPDWMQGRPLADKVAELRLWHTRDRGWRDIGYHWIIDRNGDVMPGRPETVVGAHVQGRNSGTIGICLIGGHGSSENDRFAQHFTPEQDGALRNLIEAIGRRSAITRVSGHNEFAAKACPGFNVPRWLAGRPDRGLVESRTMQGGAVAGVGTIGTAASEMAAEVQPLTAYADTLKWVFLALALAGIGITLYARLDDWRRGRH